MYISSDQTSGTNSWAFEKSGMGSSPFHRLVQSIFRENIHDFLNENGYRFQGDKPDMK